MMTELERRVRESLESAARVSAVAPPDAADLLARAHRSRAVRQRLAMAGIAAVFMLVLPLVLLLADREDRGVTPAATPSASPSLPGWKVLEDSGLKMSVPPGTLVDPSVCPIDGQSYVMTAGRTCRMPSSGGPIDPAPVIIWIRDNREYVAPPTGRFLLQTLNRNGLSGFVEPMGDPGFIPNTYGARYTWNLVDNTTTTGIYIFGSDQLTAQRVIDSLRLAHR